MFSKWSNSLNMSIMIHKNAPGHFMHHFGHISVKTCCLLLKYREIWGISPWPHVWLHVYCCSQVNLPPLFLPSSHALLPFSTPHLPPFLFLPPPFFSISLWIPPFTGNSLVNSREFPMITLGIPQFMGIPGEFSGIPNVIKS